MSETIDVIPSLPVIPTIQDLHDEILKILTLLSKNPDFERVWRNEGITTWENPDITAKKIKIEAILEVANEESDIRSSYPGMPLSFKGYTYGFLSMDDYKTGFDFYYCSFDIRDPAYWREFVMDVAESARSRGALQDFPFEEAAKINHQWFMRLSCGRPPSAHMLAGIAAAALARLTDGIIYSSDGGADPARIPTEPSDFLEWYPEWCDWRL